MILIDSDYVRSERQQGEIYGNSLLLYIFSHMKARKVKARKVKVKVKVKVKALLLCVPAGEGQLKSQENSALMIK